MKSILITLLFLCLIPATKAQTNVYYPFPDSGAKWNETEWTCNCDNAEGSFNSYGYYYKETHDTIINAKTYHLLNLAVTWAEAWAFYSGQYLYNNSSNIKDPAEYEIGAIREDSLHRIFYRDFQSPQNMSCPFDSFPKDSDILIYDFSLKPGDSTTSTMYMLGKAKVIGYDSVLIGTTYHNALMIKDSSQYYNIGTDEWVEGVGSIYYGLLGTTQPELNFEGTCNNTLNCFSVNTSLLYPPHFTGSCDTIIPTGINTPSAQKLFMQIYPNPVNDELYLIFSPGYNVKQISIYSYLGQMVYKSSSGYLGQTKQTIDVSNFSAGLYFVKAISDGGVLTGNFIKE